MDLLSGDYGLLFPAVPSTSRPIETFTSRARRTEQESPLLDFPDDDSVVSQRSRRSGTEMLHHATVECMSESISALASDEECSQVRARCSSLGEGASIFSVSDDDDDGSRHPMQRARTYAGHTSSGRGPSNHHGELSPGARSSRSAHSASYGPRSRRMSHEEAYGSYCEDEGGRELSGPATLRRKAKGGGLSRRGRCEAAPEEGSHGGLSNVRDGRGQSPLHLASARAFVEGVRILVIKKCST
jgi:hypothetical protein